MKKGKKQPFSEGNPRKFKEEKVKGGEKNQGAGHSQNHLGLHLIPLDMQTIGAHILPGQKADAAQNNQKGDDQRDNRVRGIIRQRRERSFDSHEIEARITKGGYGVKESIPGAPKETKLPGKHRKQKGCPCQLNGKHRF